MHFAQFCARLHHLAIAGRQTCESSAHTHIGPVAQITIQIDCEAWTNSVIWTCLSES